MAACCFWSPTTAMNYCAGSFDACNARESFVARRGAQSPRHPFDHIVGDDAMAQSIAPLAFGDRDIEENRLGDCAMIAGELDVGRSFFRRQIRCVDVGDGTLQL